MKTGIALSVRNKARRLPGKVLLPLGEGNVTEFLIRRLFGSQRADLVLVATSTDPRDTILDDIARAEGVPCFRGSPDDKLLRYRDAARAFDLDLIVVVDGDDPFVSVSHIDRIITAAIPPSPDLVTFTGLPLGATGFGMTRFALEQVCTERPEADTEVWGALFREDGRFRCVDLREENPRYARPDVRMTLDFEEDYRFFRTVIDGLARHGVYPSFEAVMAFLNDHPEVAMINHSVQSAYEANLQASIEAGARARAGDTP